MAITSAKCANYSSVAMIVTLSDSTAIPQYKASYGVTIHINEIPPVKEPISLFYPSNK
jgi:hypothetical protein